MQKACRKAASAIARDFIELEHLYVSQKAHHDFLTGADIKASNILTEELNRYNRNHYILDEEGDKVSLPNRLVTSIHSVVADTAPSNYVWIIDPIDGTSNFAHGHPNYAITIALMRFKYTSDGSRCVYEIVRKHIQNPNKYPLNIDKDKWLTILSESSIIAGVTYLPYTKETYWAELGQGAFFSDIHEDERRLRMPQHKDLRGMLISTKMQCTQSQQYEQFLSFFRKHSGKLRISGSIAMDLAYVAHGRSDIFLSDHNMNLWDVATGLLLVIEAGGWINGYDGNNVVRFIQNNVIVASNSDVGIKFAQDVTI